jgi:hypothetical protein
MSPPEATRDQSVHDHMLPYDLSLYSRQQAATTATQSAPQNPCPPREAKNPRRTNFQFPSVFINSQNCAKYFFIVYVELKDWFALSSHIRTPEPLECIFANFQRE